MTTSTNHDVQPGATRIVDDCEASVFLARGNYEEAFCEWREERSLTWSRQTRELAKLAPRTLLDQLAERGFSWTDIARMCHVSVSAIRKWRRGEPVSGTHRFDIASLVALCDILEDFDGVHEVASWMEMPLMPGVPISCIDLVANGDHESVFSLAANHEDSEQVLSRFAPNWREDYRSDFEVVLADDGNLSIQPKEGENS